jgi:hypothetical protein
MGATAGLTVQKHSTDGNDDMDEDSIHAGQAGSATASLGWRERLFGWSRALQRLIPGVKATDKAEPRPGMQIGEPTLHAINHSAPDLTFLDIQRSVQPNTVEGHAPDLNKPLPTAPSGMSNELVFDERLKRTRQILRDPLPGGSTKVFSGGVYKAIAGKPYDSSSISVVGSNTSLVGSRDSHFEGSLDTFEGSHPTTPTTSLSDAGSSINSKKVGPLVIARVQERRERERRDRLEIAEFKKTLVAPMQSSTVEALVVAAFKSASDDMHRLSVASQVPNTAFSKPRPGQVNQMRPEHVDIEQTASPAASAQFSVPIESSSSNESVRGNMRTDDRSRNVSAENQSFPRPKLDERARGGHGL